MNISNHNLSALNRLKFFGLLSFVLLLFFSIPSLAQEKLGFPNEENYRPKEESNIHTEPPAVLNKEKNVTHDTASVQHVIAVRPKPDESVPKKTEEETLSFNVLYFIIQKFKVSDMVN